MERKRFTQAVENKVHVAGVELWPVEAVGLWESAGKTVSLGEFPDVHTEGKEQWIESI